MRIGHRTSENLPGAVAKRTLLRMGVLMGMLLSIPSAEAQHMLQGHVRDATSSEPLPTATIQIEDTYRGTITNAEGAFRIQVDSLPTVLVVRCIGYKTARRVLQDADAGAQEFLLEPVIYMMEELVISGEDSAIDIMRKVIERKQEWRAALLSYKAAAYNRFTISNDTGIVSIIETVTDAFWDHEQGIIEILKGRRETANFPHEAEIPAALFVTNLYDDAINIAGHRLVGVTHPNALDYYTFRLDGIRQRDGTDVYDILVEPNSKLSSGFVGRISVLDGAYAMIDAELRPGESFLFPIPIRRLTVTYRQQFSSFGGSFWLPVDLRSEVEFVVSVPGLITIPPFYISQVSRMADYAVNESLPDSLFADDEILHVDSVAVAADSVLQMEGLAVPLSSMETLAYASIDSTMLLEDAFAPTGPVADVMRAQESADNAGMDAVRAAIDWLLPENLRLAPALWYNRVDAFHGELRATYHAGTHVRFGADGGWSSGPTGEDRWSYDGMARLTTAGTPTLSVEGHITASNALRYRSLYKGRFTNSLPLLLRGVDYFDYYRSKGYSVTAGVRVERWRTELSATFLSEEHASLQTSTSYDLLGKKKPFRENPSIDPGMLRALAASVTIRGGAPAVPLIGRRELTLHVEHSTPGALGSDFHYTRYEFVLDWRAIRTFTPRRLLPNTLDIRLVLGGGTGTLPPQRAFVAEATGAARYHAFGTLHTLSGLPYVGRKVTAFYWEHNFRSLFFEIIGMRNWAERGVGIILYGGHARTWTGRAGDMPESAGRWASPDRFHHEIGISLSGIPWISDIPYIGILGLLRVNVTKRLDARGVAVGFGVAKIL